MGPVSSGACCEEAQHLLSFADPQQIRFMDLIPKQCAVLDGLQRGTRLPVLLWLCAVYQRALGDVSQQSPPAILGGLVPSEVPRQQVQLWG